MLKRILLVLIASMMFTACQTPAPQRTSMPSDLPDVVERLGRDGSAIVGVAANVTRPQPPYDAQAQWLDNFFPRVLPLPGSREAMRALQNIGAGVIISQDGLILTNAHVVADASRVSVHLADRRPPYPARVLGVDRATDLALLKIDAVGLPVASFGRSSELRDGEWVAAVGSPGDLPATASAGVVNARTKVREAFIPFVRTSSVDPPVSSGMLVNARGEVVGINSGVVGPRAGHRDAGAAVPIETALEVARHLRAYGEVRRRGQGLRS